MMSLPFGKNKGKVLNRCEESYIKWLATHKNVLKPCNQPYADDAKQLLEEKDMQTKEGRISYLDKNCIDINHFVLPLADEIKQEVNKSFKVGDDVIVTVDDDFAIKVERKAA